MARRLIESGFHVVLWARRPEALAPFSDVPFEAAASLTDLAARVEHVGICVVDDAGVKQVCDEVIPALKPGGRIAIHSTVHPRTVVELARQASARGLALIDAPVSGGGPAASARTLTVMCGADEPVFTAARPIFEAFGGLIVRVGDPGAGQMAKLVNNALMAAHLALAHSSLAAAATLGIDVSALKEIIKVSSGRSFGFEVYARLPNAFAFDHGARLLLKDVRLLEEIVGSDPSFAAFRDIALPFLELVLKGPQQPNLGQVRSL